LIESNACCGSVFARSRFGDRAPNLQHLRNLKSLWAFLDPDFQLHAPGDATLARSFERADMQVGLYPSNALTNPKPFSALNHITSTSSEAEAVLRGCRK
jgi:hypothetical protein